MTTHPAVTRGPQTLFQALCGPRFLLTQWPWRALAYTMTTMVTGMTAAVIAMPLYLPWLLLGFRLVEGDWATLSPLVAGTAFVSGLVMIVVFAPLIAMPLGALERGRVLMVSPGPVPGGHRTPPPGLWPWVRVRFTEAATWREVAYMVLLVPIAVGMVLVLGSLTTVALVTAAAPLLVEGGQTEVALGSVTLTTFEEALPYTLLSPVFLVALLYAAGIFAQGQSALARALLVGPAREELRAELSEVTESRARLVNAFEYERSRIERDLHDGAQQRLVALSMDLGMARLDLEEYSEADRHVAEAQAKANDLIEELRQLVRGIHPRVLTDRGLPAALAELADHCPVPTRVDTEIPTRLPAHVEGTAYFVVAEALTNVYKHTEANAVTVHASTVRAESGETLQVEVTDYGSGGADPAKGSGLTGLKDRVAVMGGTMELFSPEGGPTRIRVELPCGPIPPIPEA